MRPEPSPKHSVSVAAAVIDGTGRALAVQRRDNGTWEPPGGVLELGESIPEGLAREVLEETGLTIEAESVSGVYKNMKHGIVAIVFRCHVTGGKLRASDETTAFAWLEPNEIKQRMNEVFAVRVLDAYEADGPKVRSHDGVNLLPR
ncbi:NUDIX hydrolase [Actinospica robiniae]|uniref:NUDIX hydrolase n=1 Tax=Actinospica robiniae TaxID=304901 RepID=UPI000555342F|nr:NUDIX domain-containing protein [Actinospica robiniae]